MRLLLIATLTQCLFATTAIYQNIDPSLLSKVRVNVVYADKSITCWYGYCPEDFSINYFGTGIGTDNTLVFTNQRQGSVAQEVWYETVVQRPLTQKYYGRLLFDEELEPQYNTMSTKGSGHGKDPTGWLLGYNFERRIVGEGLSGMDLWGMLKLKISGSFGRQIAVGVDLDRGYGPWRFEEEEEMAETPEPITLGLMGAGLAAIGFMKRRATRRKTL